MDWWNGNVGNSGDAFEATGDNLRESPYSQLYPRLCTQSNVFRVHYRVQVLRKSRLTGEAEWDEGRDHVVVERRGSSLVERFLAPPSSPLPDPATDPTAPSLDKHQAFRIVSKSPFSP